MLQNVKLCCEHTYLRPQRRKAAAALMRSAGFPVFNINDRRRSARRSGTCPSLPQFLKKAHIESKTKKKIKRNEEEALNYMINGLHLYSIVLFSCTPIDPKRFTL